MKDTSIAITGLGAMFPRALNVSEFWSNIVLGTDCLSELPEELHSHNLADKKDLGGRKFLRGGVLPAFDFDPMEFGIPPDSLESISVQQLASLVVAKEALQDARIVGNECNEYNRDRIGVILGSAIGATAYSLNNRIAIKEMTGILAAMGIEERLVDEFRQRATTKEVEWRSESFTGYLANITAARIANKFNFKGPNYTVDAACASSLCALQQAVEALLRHECDVVLTGGVSTNTPLSYMSYAKSQVFSPSNSIRPYSADADGTMIGDGIGMIVLKRLDDAVACNDRIYAVIKNVCISSDGNAESIFAPSTKGQYEVLKKCYEESGIDPGSIGLVEGHGTGTVRGDRSEIDALGRLFSDQSIDRSSIALGSIKSQIGHTRIAAGAAGIIKAALALYHRTLPPTIGVSVPVNGIEESALYLNLETRPWIYREQIPRRAAVNSFGFGGVNAHAILEDYPLNGQPDTVNTGMPKCFVVSAETKADLSEKLSRLLAELEHINRADLQNVLVRFDEVQIAPSRVRIGFVVESFDSIRNDLSKSLSILKQNDDAYWEHPTGIYYQSTGEPEESRVAVLFPGQGSQYPLMGSDLCMHFSELHKAFGEMDIAFGKFEDGLRLSDLVYPRTTKDALEASRNLLNRTKYTQPVLATFCSALYDIFDHQGLNADYFIGHSFGELTALWAAGVLSRDEFYQSSIVRGNVMEDCRISDIDEGKMLAIKNYSKELDEIINTFSSVEVSNINSNSQIVVAGSSSEINRLQVSLEKTGVESVLLNTPKAFHTTFVRSAEFEFKKYLGSVNLSAPKKGVISNRYGELYSGGTKETIETLSSQISNTVHFRQSICKAYDLGVRVFIELSPNKVLSSFVENILDGRPYRAVPVLYSKKKDEVRQLNEAIVKLRVMGLKLKQAFCGSVKPNERADSSSRSFPMEISGHIYRSDKKRKTLAAQTQSSKDSLLANTAAFGGDVMDADKKHGNIQSNEPSDRTSEVSGVEALVNNQSEHCRAHEKFLDNQSREARQLFELSQAQMRLIELSVNNPSLHDLIVKNIKSIEGLQENQKTLYRIHSQYLENQRAFLDELLNRGNKEKGSYSLPDVSVNQVSEIYDHEPGDDSEELTEEELLSAPLEAEGIQTADRPNLEQAIIEIVSERTGFPVEMIESAMDLESDLGVDSIKKIEIYSTINEKYPDLFENIGAEELATVRTIRELANISGTADENPFSGSDDKDDSQRRTGELGEAETTHSDITEIILEIVSAKTGYPIDMLDLEMALESDLGIDSIKRVEIFSEINCRLPDLFEDIELEELNNLNSIADIALLGNADSQVVQDKKKV